MRQYWYFIVPAAPMTMAKKVRIEPIASVDTPVIAWPYGAAHRQHAAYAHQRAAHRVVAEVLRMMTNHSMRKLRGGERIDERADDRRRRAPPRRN